jgi:penicillin-insensitive murein endopeptidase
MKSWTCSAAPPAVLLATAVIAAVDDLPAKQLFSEVTVPSEGDATPIGSYAQGCLAGAVALPLDGPHWQVMRLSRNRNWGTPRLVSYIEKFSEDAAKDGWSGLLIGDMSQPRGGPMITGHLSHQTGLDADIWFVPMPNHLMTPD